MRDARKHSGYTQKQLAEKIGAKHNSVSNWENGLNMPDPATIEYICEALCITPNYLLLGEELPVVTRGEFSSGEIGMLNKYRRLDEKSQGAVDALLNYYCGTSANRNARYPSLSEPTGIVDNIVDSVRELSSQKSEISVISGMISSQSVAAGTGTYLDKDSFDVITVEKNDLTRRAAFYVPVSGNSMEPRYHDGDILIVEKTAVGQGEIGIFTLDGNGFVKILGKGELLSLNPDYDPIPMNDDIICNGKVIGTLEPDWIIL